MQRVSPLTHLEKIAEEFEGAARPPEERRKKNVIEQNRESMAILTGGMMGVANSPLKKKKRV